MSGKLLGQIVLLMRGQGPKPVTMAPSFILNFTPGAPLAAYTLKQIGSRLFLSAM